MSESRSAKADVRPKEKTAKIVRGFAGSAAADTKGG
jgi:hypothetical protein